MFSYRILIFYYYAPIANQASCLHVTSSPSPADDQLLSMIIYVNIKNVLKLIKKKCLTGMCN